ncbi:MAG: glycosyltransferase family 4 protein [Thermodesulfovibrionales bacterium]|nr:glycosyltransferase family 4 protein [Thermodesulfovibrionales bacterium]
MRILFLIGSYGVGGKERQLAELIKVLPSNEFELHLLVKNHSAFYLEGIRDQLRSFRSLDRKHFGLSALIDYAKYISSLKPDIVHSWATPTSVLAIFARLICKHKFILIDGSIRQAPPKVNWLSGYGFQRKVIAWFSNIIVANSLAGLKSYAIDNRKGKVIYNGIDLNRFNNLVDREDIKQKNEIKTPYSIIMVASFSDMKDHDKFINVAKEISYIRQDVTFVAVGNGIHFKRIKKRVLDEHIINVIFIGQVSDVESQVSAVDIGVLFSPHGEGISNSIMEYMALGKPVIADDAGGTGEIVKHGITGYLLANESPKTIAGLISDLLVDNKQRKEMGEAGRKLIRESFTIERMGKEIEKVYQGILVNLTK